jgi:microcystin-dependent protein
MKKLFIFFLSFSVYSLQAQVGIGTAAPNSTAQLDITANDKGLLIPRLTVAQRLGIVSPATGLLVYQTTDVTGFYYYTGTAWTNLVSGGSGGVPTGTIMAFAGTVVPDGWVLCNGAAINRTANALLFTAIGTIYGIGNGSTTFNVPDLRGRTVFGLDNMGGTAAGRLTTAGGISVNNTLGATGGNQALSIAVANLPAHNHTFSGTAATTSSNSHAHTYQDAYFAEASSIIGGSVGSNNRIGASGGADTDNSFVFRTSTNTHSVSASNINTSSESHTHTVTASGTIGNTGSGTALPALNPGLVLNYIIKL